MSVSIGSAFRPGFDSANVFGGFLGLGSQSSWGPTFLILQAHIWGTGDLGCRRKAEEWGTCPTLPCMGPGSLGCSILAKHLLVAWRNEFPGDPVYSELWSEYSIPMLPPTGQQTQRLGVQPRVDSRVMAGQAEWGMPGYGCSLSYTSGIVERSRDVCLLAAQCEPHMWAGFCSW